MLSLVGLCGQRLFLLAKFDWTQDMRKTISHAFQNLLNASVMPGLRPPVNPKKLVANTQSDLGFRAAKPPVRLGLAGSLASAEHIQAEVDTEVVGHIQALAELLEDTEVVGHSQASVEH